MLTPHQITLIRSSAQRLADSDISATNLFYSNLFRRAPGVRALFPDDMFSQSEKLWASIVAVVEGIEDLDGLRPMLRQLGERHVEYGAVAAHYDAVRDTLVETVASFLGTDWSPEYEVAWQAALQFVCDTMLDGANVAA